MHQSSTQHIVPVEFEHHTTRRENRQTLLYDVYTRDCRYHVHVCLPDTEESYVCQCLTVVALENKKHLKNVGPIRHNEPPHAHSPDVASGTVARRLRIDVHDNDDNDNA